MNYPVWDLFGLGGGFWIAFIATVHVFVSHFAIGGGLWLVLAERKALKENDATFLEYLKGHSKFFLLMTMFFRSFLSFMIAGWFGLITVAHQKVRSSGKNRSLQCRGILVPFLLMVASAFWYLKAMPGAMKKPLVYVIVLTGFFHMASFEYIREAGRRPFVIHSQMYSNTILVAEVDLINEQRILKTAKWTQYSEITPEIS